MDGGLEITMYRLQMKLQRIITYLCIGAAALTFIYSLGLCTDIYFLYKLEGLNFTIPGAEMFYDIQPFNRQFTSVALVLIILSVAGLVFNNHTRRKYYVANYLTVGVSAVANIGASVWALTNVFKYKNLFLNIEFEVLQEIAHKVPQQIWEKNNIDPENLAGPYSTFWFDISIAVFAILLVVTLLNIANVVFKTVLMHKEKQLLAEGD